MLQFHGYAGRSRAIPSRRRHRLRRAHLSRRKLGCEPLELRQLLTVTVDTAFDELDGSITDGDVSFRDALALAPSGETIDFDPSLAGNSIDLSLGELTITRSFTIDASGLNGGLSIDAQDDSRVLKIDDANIGTFLDVEIRGLTITGGQAGFEYGGGIFSLENLTVAGSTITGNSSEAVGGGIYSAVGNVLVTSSTISGNSAGTEGGGIYGDGVDITLIDSIITGNLADSDGGGIYIAEGSLAVTGSTISDNTASSQGGGINSDDGDLDVTDSTLTGNSASFGGGIYHAGGILNVTRSTISGNAAEDGGGVFSDNGLLSSETTTLRQSTISGNTASGAGGGIFNNDGRTIIQNSTITANQALGLGSGVASIGDALTVTEFLSTIVAGNVSNDVDFVEGSVNSFQSNGDNLIGTGTAVDGLTFINNDQTGVTDPMLGPLADNGGPTLTHPLLPGSPALNQGSNPLGLLVDQRGAGFVRTVDGQTDVGAIEEQNLPPLVTNVQRDDGSEEQLDALASLSFTFSEDVGPSIDAGDLSLSEVTLGMPPVSIDLSGATVTYNSVTNSARWDFSGLSTTLPSGRYEAVLAAAGIVDASGDPLDGDASGTGGDDFILTDLVVALPGDTDTDGDIDIFDILNINLAGLFALGPSNASWIQGDFDGNDQVDIFDILLINQSLAQIGGLGSMYAARPGGESALNAAIVDPSRVSADGSGDRDFGLERGRFDLTWTNPRDDSWQEAVEHVFQRRLE